MPDPLPENPLVPNAALERMASLVQAMRRTRPAAPPRALEAVYAGLLTTLRPGDLLADLPGATVPPNDATPLPLAAPASADQLLLALGAAAALRAQDNQAMLAAILPIDALPLPAWRRTFTLAAASRLPVLFLALPDPATQGALSRTSQRSGVPGIPVDAADPIALFRVLSECALRARNGDGPALVEPLRWVLAPQAAADPLRALTQLLHRRGVAPAPSSSPHRMRLHPSE